jgi:hypothetical protein
MGTANADGLLEYCDERNAGASRFYRAFQME